MRYKRDSSRKESKMPLKKELEAARVGRNTTKPHKEKQNREAKRDQ